MAISMKLSDNSPKNKRRMVAASGGIESPSNVNNQSQTHKYASPQTASIPITKNAQFAGSGANVVWTQPMFFSPLHTPQNWQVPSKRREMAQWSFIEPCFITLYEDFSLVPVSRFIDDTKNKNNMYIQNGSGEKSFVDMSTKRHVRKKANNIRVLGIPENLFLTNDHNCMVIKKSEVDCIKSFNNKKCILDKYTPTCKRLKCNDCFNKEYKISKEKANTIVKGDYFLIPFNTEVKDSIIKNKEQARFAGHLASDGSVSSSYHDVEIVMNINEIDYVYPSLEKTFSNLNCGCELKQIQKKLFRVRTSNNEIYNFASKITTGKGKNKKFTKEVVFLDPELQKHVIGAYIQSDGSFNKINKNIEITTYSPNLANQLLMMLFRCGILANSNKQKISSSKKTFNSTNTHRYIISIPSSECKNIREYVPGKIKEDIQLKKQRGSNRFFYKNYVVSPVVYNKEFDYDGYVYDIREPKTNTVVANNISIYQCRFYYSNESKVAAGVDFYSNFSMNGYKLECKNKKVLRYYEKLVKKLKLSEKLNSISHEYFLLGDVFPFLEISCPNCKGSGYINGKPCNHPDGSFKSVKLMNPDYIEVKDNPIASAPEYYLVPDEELKMIVQRKEPKSIYEQLPINLIKLISAGQPIPLSSRSISHIKHNASDYGTYGTPMLQRLFTILAYKTKIMTANWIVAERLILPIRIVKVGDKDRPASEADIGDVVTQLSAVANDPNLTVVTHHAFEYDWIGATGKIHNITQELEYIGKEVLDGLMLNQAILNGEMSGYGSAQVGIEVLIRRLDNWRNILKEWVEERIFLPVAMMQGFIDEEESKELGERVYLYPRLKWNDLQLRDKTQKIQTMLQCNDKGFVSAQSILEELDLDYDTEVEKLRSENIMASQAGLLTGQGGEMGGGLGGLMGGGGGGMPPDMGGMPGPEGEMGGDMAGGMGGDMAGGMGGDMAGGMGGDMGAAASQQLPVIKKRGEKRKEEDQKEYTPPVPIKLTKLEYKMFKILSSLNIPTNLFAQYQIKVPGETQPFVLDFAYPKLGVGIETDGNVFHERPDFKQRDMQRDQKLAQRGWRVLRFREDALTDNADAVKKVIIEHLKDSYNQYKQSEDSEKTLKYASLNNINPMYEDMIVNNDKIGCFREKTFFGEILYIGRVDNGDR